MKYYVLYVCKYFKKNDNILVFKPKMPHTLLENICPLMKTNLLCLCPLCLLQVTTVPTYLMI